MRKQKQMLDEGRIDFQAISQSYQSWRGYASQCDSFRTVQNMDRLFGELFLQDFISGKEQR